MVLKTGLAPIATVMRRLLTGYAVSFNRRHRRHGHLLQNRYKSFLCEEDVYLKELVRYIHLNPLEGKYRLQVSVISLSALIDKVAHCYKIDPENLKSASKERPATEARRLLCYIAVRKLGYKCIEVSRALGISISIRRAMEQDEIEVYNYLDEHATVKDNNIEEFSITRLQNEFPEVKISKLKAFESEWRAARQRMLNLKFDDDDFK